VPSLACSPPVLLEAGVIRSEVLLPIAWVSALAEGHWRFVVGSRRGGYWFAVGREVGAAESGIAAGFLMIRVSTPKWAAAPGQESAGGEHGGEGRCLL